MTSDREAPAPPAAPIGRVRFADVDAAEVPDRPFDDARTSGWSVAGAGVALLVLLLMIGALVIILWAAFQTRA